MATLFIQRNTSARVSCMTSDVRGLLKGAVVLVSDTASQCDRKPEIHAILDVDNIAASINAAASDRTVGDDVFLAVDMSRLSIESREILYTTFPRLQKYYTFKGVREATKNRYGDYGLRDICLFANEMDDSGNVQEAVSTVVLY
jgi:hypothetical protein